MQATVSSNSASHRSFAASLGVIEHAQPTRRIGVVDGLVSITQNAWAVAAFAQQRMKVLQ